MQRATPIIGGFLLGYTATLPLLGRLADALASFATLVSEMTALRVWPATRAIPIAFGIEMTLPAAAAPFLTTTAPPQLAAFVVALGVAGAGALVLGARGPSPSGLPSLWGHYSAVIRPL